MCPVQAGPTLQLPSWGLGVTGEKEHFEMPASAEIYPPFLLLSFLPSFCPVMHKAKTLSLGELNSTGGKWEGHRQIMNK